SSLRIGSADSVDVRRLKRAFVTAGAHAVAVGGHGADFSAVLLRGAAGHHFGDAHEAGGAAGGTRAVGVVGPGHVGLLVLAVGDTAAGACAGEAAQGRGAGGGGVHGVARQRADLVAEAADVQAVGGVARRGSRRHRLLAVAVAGAELVAGRGVGVDADAQ